MSWIFVLTILLFGITILIILLYEKPIKLIGGVELVYYHGSPNKYNVLKPRYSDYGGNSVFGIPSYDDAVIFAAHISDKDIIMWGDSKYRYIEEQYPGAFNKLKITGYIHHIHGNFKSLGKGLPNEYITDKEVVPFKVDKINIYKYLKSSKVIMNTFTQFLKRRRLAPRITLDPDVSKNVICCVVGMKKEDFTGVKPIYIHELDMNNTESNEKYVILGDLLLGNEYFEFKCPHWILYEDKKMYPDYKVVTKQKILNYYNKF